MSQSTQSTEVLAMIVRLIPFLLLTCGVLFHPVHAHPSVAVVMDSQGTIYYSDLENVWMIHPDGTKRIAVPDVHTHELWVDAEDRLHGEDVTNIGESYRHRVWVRSPDGTVSHTIPWRDGHPTDHADYAFVRDDVGRSYVLRRNTRRIDVRQNGTVVYSINLDPFEGFIHWMTRGKTGDLFVSIGSDVYRVPGATDKPIRMASDLVETSDQFSFARGRHATMGMWTDAAGNVFVTVFAGQRVKRISPDGAVATVYQSPANWSPTGGVVAPDGSLWILEYSTSNRVRVQRRGTDGSTRVF